MPRPPPDGISRLGAGPFKGAPPPEWAHENATVVAGMARRAHKLLPVVNIGIFAITVAVAVFGSSLGAADHVNGRLKVDPPLLLEPPNWMLSALWLCCCLLLVLFVVFQALPSTGVELPQILDSCGFLFVALCVLSVVRVCVTYKSVALMMSLCSVLSITFTAELISRLALAQAKRVAAGGKQVTCLEKICVQLPFSAYLGWTIIQTAVNTSYAFREWGWTSHHHHQQVMACACEVLAALVGLRMLFRRHNAGVSDFPCVIALLWWLVAILGQGRKAEEPGASTGGGGGTAKGSGSAAADTLLEDGGRSPAATASIQAYRVVAGICVAVLLLGLVVRGCKLWRRDGAWKENSVTVGPRLHFNGSSSSSSSKPSRRGRREAETAAAAATVATVTPKKAGGTVKLRSAPGRFSPTVAGSSKLSAGQPVTVVGAQAVLDAKGGAWWEVRIPDETTGWLPVEVLGGLGQQAAVVPDVEQGGQGSSGVSGLPAVLNGINDSSSGGGGISSASSASQSLATPLLDASVEAGSGR